MEEGRLQRRLTDERLTLATWATYLLIHLFIYFFQLSYVLHLTADAAQWPASLETSNFAYFYFLFIFFLELCILFNVIFVWVYFFQLHLKDFFLNQEARLFGSWFILGSIILTVWRCGVASTIPWGGEKWSETLATQKGILWCVKIGCTNSGGIGYEEIKTTRMQWTSSRQN